jgi:hypothetical protein
MKRYSTLFWLIIVASGITLYLMGGNDISDTINTENEGNFESKENELSLDNSSPSPEPTGVYSLEEDEQNVEPTTTPTPTPTISPIPTQTPLVSSDLYFILKDVGEPYLNRFGLGPADFNKIKEAGFNMVAMNFDICANSSDVIIFLDAAKDAGLKVIMTAGAGEAEWGYPCDEQFDANLKPQWEKEKVQAWVRKWAYHSAIYAWDISNEDGQNFPNAIRVGDNWAEEGFAVSTSQLQEAYKDVKEADPTRPIIVRMNGWFFYDNETNFFREGNAFGSDVADIVMINAYSNVDEYFPNFVEVVSTRARNAIKAFNPNAKIIISLGAWQEPPIWVKPTLSQFNNDFIQAKKTKDLLGIAVFKYGAEQSDEWWIPRDAPELWSVMSGYSNL